MGFYQSKIVLITGGASGIGKIMGRMVLEQGAAGLIIWDINQIAMEDTRQELVQLGRVTCYHVDLSSRADIALAVRMVKEQHGIPDILINNAGIVSGKFFHEHTETEIGLTMEVNAMAPMLVTAGFLKEMISRNSGHICNIASSAGLISNPKMSVYVASKWAVTGWSDSLRIEMRQMKKKIAVTTVTPYYISTGMFDGVKSLVPILKPEKTAAKIIRGIERRRIYVSMPWSVHFVRFGQGILPVRLFDWLIGGVMGVYHTMDHFKGRSG